MVPKAVPWEYVVAVDGGYWFCKKLGVIPDLLIGDFDSIVPFPKSLPQKTQIFPLPREKDMTDTHAALVYCLKSGTQHIDIIMPGVGEPDHFVANLFLLVLSDSFGTKRTRPCIRLVNPGHEIVYLRDESYTIQNAIGNSVSVVPLLNTIRLTSTGSAYDVSDLLVKRGETRAVRNEIRRKTAVFTVKGQALLFCHRFK